MPIGGLVGVLSFHEGWDVSAILRYSLLSLSHRGTRYWIAVLDDGRIKTQFANDIDEIVLKGNAGIGCVTNEGGPGVVRCGEEEVAYCIDGEPLSPGKICGLLKGIDPGKSTAVIGLSSAGYIFAYRPPDGRRPLVMGSYGFDLVIIASETAAIDSIGGTPRSSIRPGSLIRASRLEINEDRLKEGNPRPCALEFLYMSRLDSVIDGVSTYEFRASLAKRLARRLKEAGIDRLIDIVVGVPETGIIYAIKVGEELGKPVELAIQGITRRRSALRDELLERQIAIHLKANPVTAVLRGRRALLIDDSVLTGLTLKEMAQVLRHKGFVREIHVGIACPRIVEPCPFGVQMPKKEALLCNAFKDMNDITRVLEVDSITWTQIEDLIEVSKLLGFNPCMKCMGVGYE